MLMLSPLFTPDVTAPGACSSAAGQSHGLARAEFQQPRRAGPGGEHRQCLGHNHSITQWRLCCFRYCVRMQNHCELWFFPWHASCGTPFPGNSWHRGVRVEYCVWGRVRSPKQTVAYLSEVCLTRAWLVFLPVTQISCPWFVLCYFTPFWLERGVRFE